VTVGFFSKVKQWVGGGGGGVGGGVGGGGDETREEAHWSRNSV